MRLVAGKTKITTQALADVFQLHVAPLTAPTAVRPRHELVIRVDDEIPHAALRTHEAAGCFEIADRADVSTGKVVHEPVIADVSRAALPTATAKRGHRPALGAELDAIGQNALQHTRFAPRVQDLLGVRQHIAHRARNEPRSHNFRLQEILASAAELTANAKALGGQVFSSADPHARKLRSLVRTHQADDHFRGRQPATILEFEADAAMG